MTVATARTLLHARCPCGVVVRSAYAAAPCPRCARAEWREAHEAAFSVVFQRADGWYGVQDYETVQARDMIEVCVDGRWRPSKVLRVDADGFLALHEAGPEPMYCSHAGEGVAWRWMSDRDPAAVGPFASEAIARTVRHDHAPGYFVCGVCGDDAWKTEIARHYEEHHPGSLERVVDDVPVVLWTKVE
jgi:hypothetical protein